MNEYDKMYELHYGYLVTLTQKYPLNDLDFDDTIQEYGLVLMKAVDIYNGEYAFTTLLDTMCYKYMLNFNKKIVEKVHSLDFVVYNDIGGESELTLLELVGDNTYNPECEHFLDKLKKIRELLMKLPRGLITLAYYFGVTDQYMLAKQFGITQQRINQINAMNIRKARQRLCLNGFS